MRDVTSTVRLRSELAEALRRCRHAFIGVGSVQRPDQHSDADGAAVHAADL